MQTLMQTAGTQSSDWELNPHRSIIGGSCHKYHFCRDKTRLLSRQKYACRDKTFCTVQRFCRKKHTFVATKHVFCPDKNVFAANFFVAILVAAPANNRRRHVRQKSINQSRQAVCSGRCWLQPRVSITQKFWHQNAWQRVGRTRQLRCGEKEKDIPIIAQTGRLAMFFPPSVLLSSSFGWVMFYVHRNRRLIRDGSPGRPPRLSHISWALVFSRLKSLFYVRFKFGVN